MPNVHVCVDQSKLYIQGSGYGHIGPCIRSGYNINIFIYEWTIHDSGLILGLRPANKRRRRYVVTTSHWLGTSLDSALLFHVAMVKLFSSFATGMELTLLRLCSLLLLVIASTVT